MSLADRIRAHVVAKYVEPARERGDSVAFVRAGDVHREMGLSNAMPAVCSAIGGPRFARVANVVMVDRTGPRNGANVYFTFSLDEAATAEMPEPARTRSKNEASPSADTRLRRAINLTGSLVLVSCVKRKGSGPAPARDLYTSAWFTKVRALVESQDASWLILSALHGLVRPDEVIEPYEKTLMTMDVVERRAWAARVLRQLEPLLDNTPRITLFAGERYREFLVEPLRGRGLKVEVPLEGLSIGQQLSWLTEAR